jgi:hypothetical protein
LMTTAQHPPRNVHVLFIHGVGRHSRLSSLLEAYQAIRSNLLSAEAPITFEDPIPNWRLAEFADGASPPYVKLEPRFPGAQSGPTQSVYFYEVNYAALTGVIRENHPLDITRLFVGFDLAVNVARKRFRKSPPSQAFGGIALDHRSLASAAQGLATVLVAATVPILGVPSWILRNYTETFVATFTRFFEDIATFALDKNGEQLISAHVDSTVTSIVSGPRFSPSDNIHEDDMFVIAAHSLGTVVAHNFLVRAWGAGGRPVPSRFLTFGCPIGLVCWLWLFLDFPKMTFVAGKPSGDHYFSWTPEQQASGALKQVQWINVLNFGDPLATAFPNSSVDLSATDQQIANALDGGKVKHRYIRTGGAFSSGFSHTAYFNDRLGFVELLLRLTQLRPLDPLVPAQKKSSEHWNETKDGLLLIRFGAWALGFCVIGLFLQVISDCYNTPELMLLLVLFMWPALTICSLAFFQRAFFGGPTKRTPPEEISDLPSKDIASFPYWARHKIGLGRKKPDPLAPGPTWFWKLCCGLVSFLPTVGAMMLPLYVAAWLSPNYVNPLSVLGNNVLISTLMILIFAIHLLLFAISEFARHWRTVVVSIYGPEQVPFDPSTD